MAYSIPYALGMDKWEIDTPALLLDLEIMESNISEMARFFKSASAGLRPHIKNHMSPLIAHKQMDAGAVGICCQTIREAEIMVYSGIKDILLTNEIVGSSKIERLLNMTGHAHVMAVVDSPGNIEDFSVAAHKKGVTLDVLIDLDTGYDRCGVLPGEPALKLAKKIVRSKGLHFKGINGYTPMNEEQDPVKKVEAQKARLKKNIDTRDLLESNGIEVEIVSAGCTKDYYISAVYKGITEVQLGTYIYMDVSHAGLMGTTPADLRYALTVLTTVISKPTEDRLIVDAGNKAIARENSLFKDVSGLRLYRLSAEQGRVRVTSPSREIEIGDKLELIPSYGDGTVNRWNKYFGIRKDKLDTIIPIYHHD
jgi:D-serine deaminase-like pyridoxal phosphate-dependent protein